MKLTLLFIFVHFLLGSLVIATAAWFLVDRLLGPKGWVAGRGLGKRRRGLFPAEEGGRGESVEFGYCFDVSTEEIYASGNAWMGKS